MLRLLVAVLYGLSGVAALAADAVVAADKAAVQKAAVVFPGTRSSEQLPLDGGKSLTWHLLLPSGFAPEKPVPVLLLLPPGAQNAKMVEAALPYLAGAALKHGFVVVVPEAPPGVSFYKGEGRQVLPALMQALRARFKLEGDKFWLAGMSNGGRSALQLALDAPDAFAAVYVFPGALEADAYTPQQLAKLRAVPVFMAVGEKDSESWLRLSKQVQQDLQAAGVAARLEVRIGEGHVLHIGDEAIMSTLEAVRAKRAQAQP